MFEKVRTAYKTTKNKISYPFRKTPKYVVLALTVAFSAYHIFGPSRTGYTISHSKDAEQREALQQMDTKPTSPEKLREYAKINNALVQVTVLKNDSVTGDIVVSLCNKENIDVEQAVVEAIENGKICTVDNLNEIAKIGTTKAQAAAMSAMGKRHYKKETAYLGKQSNVKNLNLPEINLFRG